MKNLTKIFTNPLFVGGMVMLIGTNSVNLLAYVYHLFFGRLLGPSLYGELASILSVIGLVSALVGFLGIVVVRFVAVENSDGVYKLFNWLERVGMKGGVAIFVILLLLSPFLAKALSTSIYSSVQLGPIIFFTFFTMIYSAFLQGLLRFKKLIFVGFISWGLRFVLGYMLFLWGFSLPGVTFSILASSIVGFIVSRNYVGINKEDGGHIDYEKKDELVKYSFPVLVMTIAAGSFITSDVILVRYFLPQIDSGYYAALSTLGKIIIYASAPISSVMFPIVSKSYSKKKSTANLLAFSLLATVVISLGITLTYKLFPDIAISILYGAQYLPATQYLFNIGALFSIYTLDLLLINYHLSKSKMTPSYIILAASIAQIVGIVAFHSSISEVVSVSTVVAGSLLVFLTAYSLWEIRDRF